MRGTDRAAPPARAHNDARFSARERGQDLLLLDLPGWFKRARWEDFGRRYREDIIGFALGWVTVVALISLAWGIMQIGK